MSCTAFSRRTAAGVLAAALLVLGAAPAPAQEQPGDRSRTIVSSEIGVSREAAEIRLELADGRTVEVALRDGAAWLNGQLLGAAPRGDALDRAWRDLLDAAMEATTDELGPLLVGWEAPDGEVGTKIDAALEAAVAGEAAVAPVVQANPAPEPEGRWASDTVARLNARIAELEAKLDDTRARDLAVQAGSGGRDRSGWWTEPFRRIAHGVADILSVLSVYAVLVGIGFVVVFFGRKYLEGVADTARHATIQSALVGLAASFLVLPAFILGAIALTISIVGIPVLIAWVPLFPVAVVVAAIFGYLGIAHAAGESLAERRFHGGELFKRANSYYYILTGVGLLLALYLAANVVQIAGPWLDFIAGLLMFLAVVLTWAAFTIGFGAVLLSRAGTRPKVARSPVEPDLDVSAVFEEDAHV
ncbi:MAG TPA: hypothetical protein VF158_03710 [Longimicrobiales bacterium]